MSHCPGLHIGGGRVLLKPLRADFYPQSLWNSHCLSLGSHQRKPAAVQQGLLYTAPWEKAEEHDLRKVGGSGWLFETVSPSNHRKKKKPCIIFLWRCLYSPHDLITKRFLVFHANVFKFFSVTRSLFFPPFFPPFKPFLSITAESFSSQTPKRITY